MKLVLVHERVRNVARRLLPSLAAERAIKYERRLRARRGVPAVAEKAANRVGRVVLSGPFAGMELAEGFEALVGSPVMKLTGRYEFVLHDPLERAIAANPRVVVNVGCADGYYAVGLARRLPSAIVYAYDIARSARKATAELAERNNVAMRVVVRGRCRKIPPGVDLIVCDIEGGEERLLSDPRRFARATLIVETHDHVVPGVTERLRCLFSPTHHVEVFSEQTVERPMVLDWMSDEEIRIALDEMRGTNDQHWLIATPR